MSELTSTAPTTGARTADPAHGRRYVPGMGLHWLLPLYDPMSRLIGTIEAHHRLIGHAELDSASRVLEIGCGTANLALLVKRIRPSLTVAGLDPDPTALKRAARKARAADLPLELDRGFADDLPYPDASFDRVLSSLMFHHLDADLRLASLREATRVLTPGGSLHLLDIGGEREHQHGLGHVARHSSHLVDNWDGRIAELMTEAGLTDPVEVDRVQKRIGTLVFYRAGKAE
jgi:ubiquinone/menaquinone biosynthesis C-methylase UbiE